jgi:hypothetical protein
MAAHRLKKRLINRVARSIPYHRIDTTLRAHGTFTTIDPINNLIWWKYTKAMETPAYLTFLNLFTMPNRMFVGFYYVIWRHKSFPCQGFQLLSLYFFLLLSKLRQHSTFSFPWHLQWHSLKIPHDLYT